jgi:hypothetical protein
MCCDRGIAAAGRAEIVDQMASADRGCQIRIATTAALRHRIARCPPYEAPDRAPFPFVGEIAMTTKFGYIAGTAALGLFIAVPSFLYPGMGSPAFAQASDMAGIAHAESASARAVVKSVDLQTRMVTLESNGNTIVLKAGEEVRNLPQVKPGDIIIARYYTSTAYVLAPPGTKLPDDSLTVAGARAAPGEKPGGIVGTKMVVTGLVVGVDPRLHTVALVDPAGGPVRTINVVTPEGQQSMKLIKIGDTITAIVTDAVLVGVEAAA